MNLYRWLLIRILVLATLMSFDGSALAKGSHRTRSKKAVFERKAVRVKARPKPKASAARNSSRRKAGKFRASKNLSSGRKPTAKAASNQVKFKGKPRKGSVAAENASQINAAIKKNSSMRKNGSIFWSGEIPSASPKNEAEKMANRLNAKHPKIKHSSLEMIVEKSKTKLSFNDPNWEKSSEKFAKDAKGKVRIVLGPSPRPVSVLNSLEVPQLTKPRAKGGKVSQINVFQINKDSGKLEKKHRWYNDGKPWDGPGSKPSGEWTPNIAEKKR
jgi:hypothetical protein